MMTLSQIKKDYLKSLDQTAHDIAAEISECNKVKVTDKIINTIRQLYEAAKSEQNFSKEGHFKSAYHSPITGDLEFFIARILFHYSEARRLQWEVFLRCQRSKTAPDIRIDRNKKTIAIIEIKAKAGWIQPFLSKDRFDNDIKRRANEQSQFNPEELIKKVKGQLVKYKETFHVEFSNVFFFLPTLALVHRKKYGKKIEDYRKYFSETSGLPQSNLILLSNDMSLDLSNCDNSTNYESTDYFELMVNKLGTLS